MLKKLFLSKRACIFFFKVTLLAHCILFAPRITFGNFDIGDKQDILISKVQIPNNYDTCRQFGVIVIQGTFFQFLGLCYAGLIIEFVVFSLD